MKTNAIDLNLNRRDGVFPSKKMNVRGEGDSDQEGLWQSRPAPPKLGPVFTRARDAPLDHDYEPDDGEVEQEEEEEEEPETDLPQGGSFGSLGLSTLNIGLPAVSDNTHDLETRWKAVKDDIKDLTEKITEDKKSLKEQSAVFTESMKALASSTGEVDKSIYSCLLSAERVAVILSVYLTIVCHN